MQIDTISDLDGGLRDGSGEKPQRKVWHAYGRTWLVYPSDGLTYLWVLSKSEWRKKLCLFAFPVRADIEIIGDRVAVLGVPASMRPVSLRILDFDTNENSYRILPQNAKEIALPFALPHPTTATVAADGDGRLFTCYTREQQVCTTSSKWPYTSWSPISVLYDGVREDDICALQSMSDGSVVAVWSDQIAKRFSARVFEPDTNSWGPIESYERCGMAVADDHISCVADVDGNLYVAVKTSLESQSPLIGLLKRSVSGEWTLSRVSDSGTRPVVSLNRTTQTIYIAYSSRPEHNIVLQQGNAVTGVFDPQVRTIIWAGGGKRWNNATVAEEVVVDSEGSRLMLAACSRDETVLRSRIVNV